MKKVMVCIDRDGTLINDDKYYLGREDGWRAKVKILPGVVAGLRLIKGLKNVAVYMITNQAGVAIADYPLLTDARAHEVCRHVLAELAKAGAAIDGYFLCPHASPAYAANKPDLQFHPELLQDCQCLKPALGMVFAALKAARVSEAEADIYVIGDRQSDVHTALNINGIGILIPFVNEPGEEQKVREIEAQKRIFIARDLVEAAEFIRARHDA